jgi:phage terminase large subunit-like protein
MTDADMSPEGLVATARAVVAKTTRAKARPQRTKRDWPALLKMIPGYDCNRDAEGFKFEPALADRVCDFFETQLVMIEGECAGNFFQLLPWQQATVGCLFGWVYANGPQQGLRRYRETLIYVPKKNGKSPLCGGLLDYMLLCDGEPGVQAYCAAADKEQANIVFRHAAGMLQRNPGLMAAGKAKVFRTSRCIESNGVNFARVLSADAAGKHGYNSSFVVIDEVHTQPNRELLDVLVAGTSSRRQPLVIYITTADWDRPSICNEKHAYAVKVRDGLIKDASFLPVIYEAGKDEDWEDEKVWWRVNPSLGVAKKVEYMRHEAQKAKDEPSFQNTFRRLELNQKTNVSQLWFELKQWDKSAGSVDDAVLAPLPCWGGLDLSTTTDVTSLALAWLVDDLIAIRSWFWLPEDRARWHEKTDRVPYTMWADQGLVELTPGNVIDYGYVRDRVKQLATEFKLQDIGTDPWNATQVATQLTEIDGIKVVEFRQGFASMSGPCKEFERRVMAGTLRHGGNPVLRWMAGNSVIRSDPAGNIKCDKEKSSARIDGIVAAIMAIGRATAQSAVPVPEDVFETVGLRTL